MPTADQALEAADLTIADLGPDAPCQSVFQPCDRPAAWVHHYVACCGAHVACCETHHQAHMERAAFIDEVFRGRYTHELCGERANVPPNRWRI